MNNEISIDIKDLHKRYGKFHALSDLSLQVYAGEIFGFLGVNGAGKTTTIRMMVGVLQPSSGSIKLGPYDLLTQPEKAKSIVGYIPDRPYIYGKLTAREFLLFISDLYLVPTKKAANRIEELLSDYSLLEWQDELVEGYSHGMKQRLATCAALVHDPKILIVDEPMVGLDPHGAKFLKQSFKRYAKQGMCIFLSTHSLNVAEEVADRLAIIQKGKILTSGTFEQIKQQQGGSELGLENLFLELTSPGSSRAEA